MIKGYVDALVRSEMATFSRHSKNYLEHLPYPQLKFSDSSALQVDYSLEYESADALGRTIVLLIISTRLSLIGFQKINQWKSLKCGDIMLRVPLKV